MDNYRALSHAKVARNFCGYIIIIFFAPAKASVARNFLGALLSKKGTVNVSI